MRDNSCTRKLLLRQNYNDYRQGDFMVLLLLVLAAIPGLLGARLLTSSVTGLHPAAHARLGFALGAMPLILGTAAPDFRKRNARSTFPRRWSAGNRRL